MNELDTETSDFGDQLDVIIRENPTKSILWALVVGVAIAFVVRALQPRPAEHRAARLLEVLREQLVGLAQPAIRRANALGSNGASLAHDGLAHLYHLRLDRPFDSVTSKLRSLFR
jgi:hypothetical protein